MKKGLMVAALSTVLMALPVSSRVYAQGVNLTGHWQVLRDGKSETTLVTLSQGDSVPASGHQRRAPHRRLRMARLQGYSDFLIHSRQEAFQCNGPPPQRRQHIFRHHRAEEVGHDQDNPRQGCTGICSSFRALVRHSRALRRNREPTRVR